MEFLQHQRVLGPDEMGISVNLPSVDTFYSTGLAYSGVSPQVADKVTITVTNGNFSVDLPQMSGYTITSTYVDSALFSGVFSQP